MGCMGNLERGLREGQKMEFGHARYVCNGFLILGS
jgi:hypothetical protein